MEAPVAILQLEAGFIGLVADEVITAHVFERVDDAGIQIVTVVHKESASLAREIIETVLGGDKLTLTAGHHVCKFGGAHRIAVPVGIVDRGEAEVLQTAGVDSVEHHSRAVRQVCELTESVEYPPSCETTHQSRHAVCKQHDGLA